MRIGKPNNQTSATITKAKEKDLLKRGRRTKKGHKERGEKSRTKKREGPHIPDLRKSSGLLLSALLCFFSP